MVEVKVFNNVFKDVSIRDPGDSLQEFSTVSNIIQHLRTKVIHCLCVAIENYPDERSARQLTRIMRGTAQPGECRL